MDHIYCRQATLRRPDSQLVISCWVTVATCGRLVTVAICIRVGLVTGHFRFLLPFLSQETSLFKIASFN